MNSSILSSIVQGIHLRSNLTPDVDLTGDDLWSASPTPNPELTALQPQITFDIVGADPIVVAPYGAPGPTQYGGIAALGAFGLALFGFAAYGAVRLVKG